MTANDTLPNALILKVYIGKGRVKHVALVLGASGADTQQQLAGQPRLDAPLAVMCRDLKPGLHILLKRVWCDTFHFGKWTNYCSERALHVPNCKVRFKLLSEKSAARTCAEMMRPSEEDSGITTAWFTAFHYGGEVQQTHLYPHRGGAFLDDRLPVCVPGGQQHLLLHKWREGALYTVLTGIWVSLQRTRAGRRRPLQNHVQI